MVGEFHSASTRRSMRLVLVSSGVIFMTLLAAWAAMGIVNTFAQGHALLGTFLAILAMVLISVGISVIAINWRAVDAPGIRPTTLPDGGDQTGIWGVGGPSMREPGSTGVWPTRSVNRRYEERDE